MHDSCMTASQRQKRQLHFKIRGQKGQGYSITDSKAWLFSTSVVSITKNVRQSHYYSFIPRRFLIMDKYGAVILL